MSKVIELVKMRIERVRIYEQSIDVSKEPEWKLVLNYTMTSAGGENLAASRMWTLTSHQRLKLIQLLEPFIDDLKAETDIANVGNYTDSEAVLE